MRPTTSSSVNPKYSSPSDSSMLHTLALLKLLSMLVLVSGMIPVTTANSQFVLNLKVCSMNGLRNPTMSSKTAPVWMFCMQWSYSSTRISTFLRWILFSMPQRILIDCLFSASFKDESTHFCRNLLSYSLNRFESVLSMTSLAAFIIMRSRV